MRMRSNGCFFTCAYTRSKHLPWPMHGGQPGSPNYVELIRTDGSSERFSVVTALTVNTGDVIRIHTGNGAGYGNPHERDPTLIANDIRDGLLDPQRAAQIYEPPTT